MVSRFVVVVVMVGCGSNLAFILFFSCACGHGYVISMAINGWGGWWWVVGVVVAVMVQIFFFFWLWGLILRWVLIVVVVDSFICG